MAVRAGWRKLTAHKPDALGGNDRCRQLDVQFVVTLAAHPVP